MTRNNAQLKTTPSYIPTTNLTLIDEANSVWRGEVVENGDNKSKGTIIFFRRDYSETSDVDKILKEFSFNEELLGIPFTLIPANKILFQYEPSSTILRVSPSTTKIKGLQ